MKKNIIKIIGVVIFSLSLVYQGLYALESVGDVYLYCKHSNLTNDLWKGNVLNNAFEVSELQNFLFSYYGLSGKLKSTGYFGNTTKMYLQKFQSNFNINPTGNLGPITRSKIKSLCSTSSNSKKINRDSYELLSVYIDEQYKPKYSDSVVSLETFLAQNYEKYDYENIVIYGKPSGGKEGESTLYFKVFFDVNNHNSIHKKELFRNDIIQIIDNLNTSYSDNKKHVFYNIYDNDLKLNNPKCIWDSNSLKSCEAIEIGDLKYYVGLLKKNN